MSLFANILTDVGLHVLILWTFLIGFFFFFISGVENEAFTSEFNSQIQDNLPGLLTKADAASGGLIKPALNKNLDVLAALERSYDAPDPLVKSYNSWLMLLSFGISAILLIMLFIGVGTYGKGCAVRNLAPIPIKKLILKNIILFLFVAGIEGVFFLYIARKYIPVKPSQLVSDMVARLKLDVMAAVASVALTV